MDGGPDLVARLINSFVGTNAPLFPQRPGHSIVQNGQQVWVRPRPAIPNLNPNAPLRGGHPYNPMTSSTPPPRVLQNHSHNMWQNRGGAGPGQNNWTTQYNGGGGG
eukprot:CAMPEP_0172708388 /NCGR_PEP_ID=MMETSP1074-20121228/50822_1 /TAXON_ID=2916 /ORGANISM="Ceratium fusus, Strain PA161109" /LENGTH=105 /DNA_ID=CAMNT_0013531339 /DNA_START=33 /DNA_END=347 /DNA_ORIENTATION=+